MVQTKGNISEHNILSWMWGQLQVPWTVGCTVDNSWREIWEYHWLLTEEIAATHKIKYRTSKIKQNLPDKPTCLAPIKQCALPFSASLNKNLIQLMEPCKDNLTYWQSICRTIWNDIMSDKRWTFMSRHSVQHHSGQSEDFCVSLVACTCNVWRNALSHICWSISGHSKHSVYRLI